ncbi:hypothetical protein AC579_2551 [Pseudocercospora musae]|uniref:Uncharacterized protein n=1 Tax=Pseudocercospora musae TaxID=113226 RepID=A0A139I2V9_9PEZI|nr:hypothetical protein AC579_2551 [Pseudocercospora musae]
MEYEKYRILEPKEALEVFQSWTEGGNYYHLNSVKCLQPSKNVVKLLTMISHYHALPISVTETELNLSHPPTQEYPPYLDPSRSFQFPTTSLDLAKIFFSFCVPLEDLQNGLAKFFFSFNFLFRMGTGGIEY